ncbi:MAG: hypothetical protein ACYTF7_09285 [Planctomycetota bacterium]|jgi:hypothetical protein
MPSTSSTTCCAWITPEQVPLLRSILDSLDCSLEAVGHDGRSGQAAQMAESLDARACTHLHELTQHAEGALVLLGTTPQEDLDQIHELCARAERVVTLTPIPSSIKEAHADGAPGRTRLPTFTPLWRSTRGVRSLIEAIETSSMPRVLSIASTSDAHCGGLGARLFDAMDMVHTLLGEPELIDASIHPPRHGGLQLQPGNTLSMLSGEMSVHIRCHDQSSATLALSDRGGSWVRSISAMGDAGTMRCEHDHFTWTHSDGHVVEDSDATPDLTFEETVADSVGRELDIHSQTWRPVNTARVMSMCEAAMLSARTGQGESPATVLRMSGFEVNV